jgi:hypothetical protein
MKNAIKEKPITRPKEPIRIPVEKPTQLPPEKPITPQKESLRGPSHENPTKISKY